MRKKKGKFKKEISGKTKKSVYHRSIVEKDIYKIEKEMGEEFKELEGWVIQRRRFFIKLGFVVGLVAVLLIISHIYLGVKGYG